VNASQTMVNEDRLFRLIDNFFSDPSAVLFELAQNAQRSGATRLDITLHGNRLIVSDDGKGIDSAEPIVVLAESSWDPEAESAMPAGWGIFFLICIAQTVSFQSRFGSLALDCNRFRFDRDYRGSVLQHVNRQSSIPTGFRIEATLKEDVSRAILQKAQQLGYYPLLVTVNGKEIARLRAASLINHDLLTSYEGNDVYIKTESFPDSPESLAGDLAVIWYGTPIKADSWLPRAVMDVTRGTPVTPVLPYRHTVRIDDRLRALWEFLREKVVAHCIDRINDPLLTEKRELVSLMNTMSRVATAQELDRLDRFFVTATEPYHRLDCSGSSTTRTVEKAGPPPVSHYVNSVTVTVRNDRGVREKVYERDDLEFTLFLPSGLLEEVTARDNRPSWLAIPEVGHDIRIDAPTEPYNGHLRWHKAASMQDGELRIPVLAMGEYWGEVDVYYTEKPDSFHDLSQAVFERCYYSDEGNTYDTQETDYLDMVEEDIREITGVYPLYTLLSGLVPVVNTGELQSLTVDHEGKLLTLTTTEGEVKTVRLT
jgi:hypothetical protein